MIEQDVISVLDDLAPLAAAGDKAALGEILRIAHPLVHRFCSNRMREDFDLGATADDLTQDVCVALMKAVPKYRDQGRTLLSFIYGVAAHKVSDARRAARSWHSLLDSTNVVAAQEAISTDDGPEQRALLGELRDDIRALFDALPSRQKLILHMRIVLEMSAAQTARALGTTPSAVRVAQHRALSRLRAEFDRTPALVA